MLNITVTAEEQAFLSELELRSRARVLALTSCVQCVGEGYTKAARKGEQRLCECVYRAIFRAVMSRYESCCYQDWWHQVSVDFRADVDFAANRLLTRKHLRVFRLRYIQQLDYEACCKELRVSTGTFFSWAYRIEERLGQEFLTMQPVALFPTSDYFCDGPIELFNVRPVPVSITMPKGFKRRRRLNPPLQITDKQAA